MSIYPLTKVITYQIDNTDYKIRLLSESNVGTVCLLGKRKPDTTVRIGIDMEDHRQIKAESK